MSWAIQANNLTKVYEKSAGRLSRLRRRKAKSERVIAVDHIEFGIRRGELFGLLGPNGAGKTTTIKLLSTLLVPDDGTAQVNGFDIVKDEEEVRKSIGVVMGGDRGLYWRLSGRENLSFFAKLYDIPTSLAKKRINELLKLVELEERADDMVEKYSRGMKQRLHLIRGLINDPPILLLDEPTLGLDPATARVIRDFAKQELQRNQGKTILLTTHYMEEADQLCDRIAIIDHGKIITLDTPETLKRGISKVKIIKIEATNMNPDTEQALSGINGVQGVAVDYSDSSLGQAEVKMHVDPASEILPEIISFLSSKNVKIRRLEESKASLEDVFISMTGRKLRD